MAGVDTDQLIRQMETVGDKLEAHGETEALGRMINEWVICVRQLVEEIEDADNNADATEAIEAINDALKDAGGYKPLNP